MAKLPDSFIDNLLSRVDLVEIIGAQPSGGATDFWIRTTTNAGVAWNTANNEHQRIYAQTSAPTTVKSSVIRRTTLEVEQRRTVHPIPAHLQADRALPS